jgi:hypothetical protein
MQKFIPSLTILTIISALSGCNQIPIEAHANRGSPESLLDVSSEIVSVEMVSEQSADEIINWIETDQPSRAEINCFEGDPLCAKAQDVLNLYGLEYEIVSSDHTEVLLVYERVLARDCENRFIDNSVNPYNLPHPTFGCSVASNMVQMVADKRQFISPTLLDYADATSMVNAYNNFISTQQASAGASDDGYSASTIGTQ